MKIAVSRRWGRLFYCLAPLALLLGAGPLTYASEPAKTLISDIIYRADGTAASGTLLVSWPAFTTAEGKAVAAGTAGVKIGAGGAVTMHLVPNEGATPGGTYYRVTLKLDDGSSAVEYWTVPQLSPTTISAIRASMVPAAVAAQMVSRTYLDAELAQAVHRSGDESIGGVKTFSSSPVVPEPSSDLQAANKQYVDAAAAAGGGSSILALSRGGTGRNTWTAARCVRVADDGSQLEPAAGDCGSGSGSNADTVDGQHAAAFAGTAHTHLKSAISDWAHTHLKAEIGDFPSTWDWLAVSNKPAAYPPEAHNHVKAAITDWAHSHLKAEISDFAHTHVKANISDFPTSWDWGAIGNKPATFSPSPHGHAIADVTNLQSSLDGKASTGHTHVKAAITDFPAQWDWSAISGKPSTFAPPVPTRSAMGGVFMDAACGAGQHVSDIDGSGKLVCSADASTGGTDWSAITNKPSSYPSDWSTTSNKPSSYTPSAHGHAESDVTGLTTELAAKESAANKGAANGYASLDASAQVPAGQIPNLPESKITNLTTDLAAKAADAAVVHNSGNETIAGSKTFSSAIAGSITGTAAGLSANIAESQVTNLTTDLGSKADKASVTAGTQTKITYNAQGIVTGGAQAQFSDLGGSVGATQLPNPGASSKGGVQAKTCTGSDKISAIGSDAIPVCSADAGGSGADLNTPNTFTKAQTLAPDSDTAGLVVKAGTASPANNISILAASSAGVEKTWVDKDFKLHTQGLILEGAGPSIWTLTPGTNSSPVEGDFWNDTDVLKLRTSGGATKDLAFLDSNITGTAAGLTGKSFSGNGTVVGTAGSTRTAGKQVQFDASGNLVASSYDVGAAGGGAPGGTGTEIQYRAGASTFGAVTGSSVSGSDVTFGGKVQSGGSGAGVFYGAEGAATGNPGAGNYRLYVDATHNFKCEYGASPTACAFPSGSMVYPGAGVAVSTGSAWGTSKAAPSGEIVGTSDSQQLSNKTFGTGMTWPTFNQNTSGTAGGLSAAYIDWNAGSGGASIQNKPATFAPSNHALVSASHTASGLTTGQPLRATGSGTYDFGALDLANANAITGTLPWASQAHTAANVVGLFNSGSCGTTQYLKGDGSCGTPGGTGDVVAGTISDNTIPKISSAASKTIGNSLATDNGTTLAYSGTGGISATTGPVQSGGSGGGVIYGPTAASAPANPAAGNFKLWVDASGNLNCKRDATGASCVPVPSDVRSVSYIAGADSASADLTAADDQGTIWRNNLGATYRVTEVWCESNAGTPTINLQRDDGTPANLLSGDLTCTTAGATGSVASAEQDVAAGERIDFLLQAASAGAKRITVSIRLVKQ